METGASRSIHSFINSPPIETPRHHHHNHHHQPQADVDALILRAAQGLRARLDT